MFAFTGYTGSQLQVKNFLSGFFLKYCHIFLLVFLSSPQTKRHPEIKKKLSSRPRTSFLIWYIFYRRWAQAQAKNPHNIESDNTMIAMASILFLSFLLSFDQSNLRMLNTPNPSRYTLFFISTKLLCMN